MAVPCLFAIPSLLPGFPPDSQLEIGMQSLSSSPFVRIQMYVLTPFCPLADDGIAMSAWVILFLRVDSFWTTFFPSLQFQLLSFP